MKKSNFKKIIAATLATTMVAGLFTGCGSKVAEEEYRSIVLEECEGIVEVLDLEKSEQIEVYEDMKLVSGDMVITCEESSAVMLVDTDKHIKADENTCFSVEATGSADKGAVKVKLEYGSSLYTIDNKLNDDSSFEVVTPNATMSVRGTVFYVVYDEETNGTAVVVYDGVVSVTNDETGETVLVQKDENVVVKGEEISFDAFDEIDEVAETEEYEQAHGQWFFLIYPGKYVFDDNNFVTRVEHSWKVINFENDGTKYTEFNLERVAEFDDEPVEDYGFFGSNGKLAYRYHGEYACLDDSFMYLSDENGVVESVYLSCIPTYDSYDPARAGVYYNYSYDGNDVSIELVREEYSLNSDEPSYVYTVPDAYYMSYNDNGLLTSVHMHEILSGPDICFYDFNYNYNDPSNVAAGGTVHLKAMTETWDETLMTDFDGTLELKKNPKNGDAVFVPYKGQDDAGWDNCLGAFIYFEDPDKALLYDNWPNAIIFW